MSCGCAGRLHGLMVRLGFGLAVGGGWERRTRQGRVVLNLPPHHHTRTALLGICTWLLQGGQ